MSIEISNVVKIEKASNDPLISAISKAAAKYHVAIGWGSVFTDERGVSLIDKQGDIIDEDDGEAAFFEFMIGSGSASEMHKRQGIGKVWGLCITKDVRKKLGADPNGKTGIMINMYVSDASTWSRVESGDLAAFSIGGEAVREAVDG